MESNWQLRCLVAHYPLGAKSFESTLVDLYFEEPLVLCTLSRIGAGSL